MSNVGENATNELVDLAEASLALGDADAAFQLLDQVEDSGRDNRWIATQIEALRMNGAYDSCMNLVSNSLRLMIQEHDWTNAQRILLESARIYDARAQDRECIEFLHNLGSILRNVPNVDSLFRTQLISLMASRVASEGDLRSAEILLSTVEASTAEAPDRRVRASVLWARSEIAEYSGELDTAFDLMHQVFQIYVEEDDSLAIQRVVGRLGMLASEFHHDSSENLSLAKNLLEAQLNRYLGDEISEAMMWLWLYYVACELELGNSSRAIEVLDSLAANAALTLAILGYSEILYALCEYTLGNHDRVSEHLSTARAIYEPLAGNEWPNAALRKIAFAYGLLGEFDTAVEISAKARLLESDLSWCLPNFL